MIEKKYMVTLFAFDTSVGGNPFWHTAFMLSELDPEKKQLKITESYGYYAVPSTGGNVWFHSWYSSWLNSWANSALTQLKKAIGFDLDIQGNHGWLTHEKARDREKGHGLHGKTFELTEEKYLALKKHCAEKEKAQQEAVDEAVAELKQQGVFIENSSRQRHYREENLSYEIYRIEREKAQKEGREPRLEPFDLNFHMEGKKLSLKGSHTCKTNALKVLSSVLTQEQLCEFETSSLPRWVAGGQEPILLHGEGPLSQYTKKSEVIYSHDTSLDGVSLYWSVPPQNIVSLPGSDINTLCCIDAEYRDKVKSVVGQLQRLEWLLRHVPVAHEDEEAKEACIKYFVDAYKDFSLIGSQASTIKPETSWYHFFNQETRSPEQIRLQQKIDHANRLLNSLYDAIWKNDVHDPYIQCMASYLSEDKEDEICRILDLSSPTEPLRI